ncbi:MAG: hypothetical protein GY861_16635 [bacterium]|nr:hypothetical protein [bacterium]
MRAVRRWRYYCDYCKKSGGSKYWMKRHEKSCTNNPERVCKMCIYANGDHHQPGDLVELKEIIKTSTTLDAVKIFGTHGALDFCDMWSFTIPQAEVLKRLWEITSCPACIFAAIRQSGLSFMFDKFDFKKERDSVFKEYNQNQERIMTYA